jgi:hypothetical protein
MEKNINNVNNKLMVRLSFKKPDYILSLAVAVQ